ncbi:MAG: UDP-N-acetylmuramate dehydrogenase [Betaproteobacteria bacterium]|nr:UDP-N-acetylmuramate dehydrogenase [Betaproteobacteria bacterium]
MNIETNVPLQPYNTFGISAKALQLVRIRQVSDLDELLAQPALRDLPKFILGEGSNIVLTADVKQLVLKVELMGKRLVVEDSKSWLIEASAGENWHEFVEWTLANGYTGLENMAMIPGCVGACPVQNIGAYGVELQDRFDSLDAIDLQTGQAMTLEAAQCGFGYRDSVFKHAPGASSKNLGLAGRALITRVRFRLSKQWRPEISYTDLQKKVDETKINNPDAKQIFDWVCAIRRNKLPDPSRVGNAGSFFKNPTVTPVQCADIIAREPKLVHYVMVDGSHKLAAAWLIESCGWRGKSVGNAAVYDKQALVLINKGGIKEPCTGGEVMTLAKAIQTSVYERFGIVLEPEPVVV